MIKLAASIPAYNAFRAFGFPKLMPVNLTIGVTYRCNSRCKTCNVWKFKKVDEFTIDEWDKTFKSIGKTPYWFTMSGGEPFLRSDIVEICESAYKNCKPGIINIPTNSLLYNIIPDKVSEICKKCKKSNIVINLSLDGIGKDHDEIRGISGNFEKVLKNYEALKEVQKSYNNLTIGVHTVISVFNVKKIPKIYEWVMENMKPDSYITEIAEERVELNTIGAGITPKLEDYSKAIDFLREKIKNNKKFKRIGRIAEAFRYEYYGLVKKWLKTKEQPIPCFASFASAQISPEGNVWPCCIRADVMGNLRDVNYEFSKVWFGKKADKIRRSIKNKECSCPLANASYTNLLYNPFEIIKIGVKAL